MMKDVKIHSKEKNNLISIKPLENIYADRQYLASVITGLFNLTRGCLYVEASRPNYDVLQLLEKLQRVLSSNKNFESSFFGLSFFSHDVNEELPNLLSEIWFAFEHPSFSFFKKNKVEFEVKRQAWHNITSQTHSFVMFKGVEEDVLWIGKSNDLEFNMESFSANRIS